ncbi:MAG: hypothetical protein HYW95_00095 [Candidatus Wildermuthbacteria bacterium]|nr:hypothetical protein [Candidatus Wildermuthbacteria bacterium]
MEVIIATALVSVVAVSILGLAAFALDQNAYAREATQAVFLAQEALEGVRNFRDGIAWNANDPANEYDGLGVVSTGVPYHTKKSNGAPPQWQLIQGQEVVGNFTRSIQFDNVQRDGNDNIVSSGGTTDVNTKKATVTVSWQRKGAIRQIILASYFTNWSISP